MSVRRASILLSSALHVTLIAALALIRAPGGASPPVEAALVRLRLPPAEPAGTSLPAAAGDRAAAPAASAASSGPTPAPARAEAPRGQPKSPAGSTASAPSGEAPARAPRPSIGELSAAFSRSDDAAARGPLPADTMAGTPAPRGSTTPGARLATAAAAPLSRVPSPAESRSPSGPAPVASPVIRPDPRDLLREMQSPEASEAGEARTAQTRAPQGSVEPVVTAGGRSLSVQPPMPFPAGLLAEGREADVTIRIQIRADGSVIPREITQSSGDSLVDSAVERIVRAYLFNAVDGATIVEGTVTFYFRLKRGF